MSMSTASSPIRLRGVRVHNLKGVDLDLERGKLYVFTGVSGSGKSSLAFDTLYAEGQRRYVETFSPYVRQFLGSLDKPAADRIEGIPPAMAVAQQAGGRKSSRTTVASQTEIQEYLALLFARAGKVVCSRCGTIVRPDDATTVMERIQGLPEGSKYVIAFPATVTDETSGELLGEALKAEGFIRVNLDGRAIDLSSEALPDRPGSDLEVIVDRLIRGREDEGRLGDSIETAFDKGLGRCLVRVGDEVLRFDASWNCGSCGASYLKPEPALFRPNDPRGACPTCEGFGRVIDLDMARIVPDPGRSLRDHAVAPWNTPNYQSWLEDLLAIAPSVGLPVDRPFKHLDAEQVRMVMEGVPSKGFGGLSGFFRWLEGRAYKMHVRVFLSRWRTYLPCPACGGQRLRPEALAVKVGGVNAAELLGMPVVRALDALGSVAEGIESDALRRRLLEPVRSRLNVLNEIGVGYLTLDRASRTLSTGEARRVALASALGSGLVNILYVLDEPSVGLHPKDVGRLVAVLRRLRDQGNTVVVVEHDEVIVRAADELVDLGPGAGAGGGTILYQGEPAGIASVDNSPTGAAMRGEYTHRGPQRRRTPKGWLTLKGASGRNLKNLDVRFPLGVFAVVTGVSGAGKSTLVMDTLYPALLRRVKAEYEPGEPYRELAGANVLGDVQMIDQAPIGRSGRSNPVTYVKAFDEIRATFAATHEAKLRNYGASRFSFNVAGGRCDACEGNGFQTVDMQFLSDVLVRCPECQGTRYRKDTLEVTYRGKSIAEVLDLTVREAFAFFKNRPKVQLRLRPLLAVGLDYLRLGQPGSTLSGGEAQRLKIAGFLASTPEAGGAAPGAKGPTLFVLEEPTTGLHPADVAKLLECLLSLVDRGHSLLVIEHHPEMVAAADWVIELGPKGGEEGGQVVAEGTPEEVLG